ncbi:glutamate racemase [Candidatus Falkowbacteria bacterium]|nr:glutamate racemase [Candidatus Falkowbacteria bacterium]
MLKNKENFVGVFDSGFGGINILRGIVKKLPDYNYFYFGDTARTPYGTRSKEIVYEFTRQAVDFMFANGCEIIILACNTASSSALRKIQRKYLPMHYPAKKVLGVLIPAAEEAAARTKNKRVGIIATEGTVRSAVFARELTKINPQIKVFQNPCPLLVPIVEAGEQNSKAAKLILEKYLKPLIKKNVDTLILGCTHYGILEKQIRKIVGRSISIISEAKVVAKKFKDYLERHPEVKSKLGKDGVVFFNSTDLTGKFIVLGSKFFGKKIKARKMVL